MKPIANLLTSIALCAAAPYAKAQAHGNGQPALPPQNPATAGAAKHALHYGRRCILKKGAILAVSYEALERFYQVAQKNDIAGIKRLMHKDLIDRMIVDAIAIPVAPHGWAADVVEIHIPGYFGNVFTDRESLDGDVQGYLAAH
jgi:hypothetical protein